LHYRFDEIDGLRIPALSVLYDGKVLPSLHAETGNERQAQAVMLFEVDPIGEATGVAG
jgi:hypothetical protein